MCSPVDVFPYTVRMTAAINLLYCCKITSLTAGQATFNVTNQYFLSKYNPTVAMYINAYG